MRVAYCTRPCFLDTALLRLRALSELVETHLFLELAPEDWRSGLFDVAPLDLKPGLVRATAEVRAMLPQVIRKYLDDLASVHLVVHGCPRSIHPAAWKASHSAAREMRSLRPDLVHFDDISLRGLWTLLALERAIPIVMSVHDPVPHVGEEDWRISVSRRLAFDRVQRFILHNEAAKPGFCSRYRIPPQRVDVVRLGVLDIFTEWASEAATDDGRTILFFGRQSPYKGLEVLYEAAPSIAAEVPELRVVVAGKPVPGYEPPIPPPLPNGGRVELVQDYIPNHKLAELFQRATVVVCPYVEATQSGVVLTAFAFGRPVVATRVGGLSEYVRHGETGYLVPPCDPRTLTDHLIGLLSNKANRERIQARIARQKDGALSWAEAARRTLTVYEATSIHVYAAASTQGRSSSR